MKKSISPAHRRALAIGRLLTNIRQLLALPPSPEVEALIQSHTDLILQYYRSAIPQPSDEATQSPRAAHSRSDAAPAPAPQEQADPASTPATPPVTPRPARPDTSLADYVRSVTAPCLCESEPPRHHPDAPSPYDWDIDADISSHRF